MSSLLEPISLEALDSVVKKLLNNKSPGPDGLSYEFYKKTFKQIGSVLLSTFNKALTTGQIPTSWTKSYISLIPKKKQDRDKVQNWRLIALINTDTKIFLKIIANRLGRIVNMYLPQHQKDSLPGRNMVDTTLNILEVAYVLRESND
jgi:hypothetical protein